MTEFIGSPLLSILDFKTKKKITDDTMMINGQIVKILPYIKQHIDQENVDKFLNWMNTPKNHLLFIGPSGMGKTTFIKNILEKITTRYIYISSLEDNNDVKLLDYVICHQTQYTFIVFDVYFSSNTYYSKLIKKYIE